MKMVDRKGGQKLNIVDRKSRMTPKRQRIILKVKEMTQEAKDNTKNDKKLKNETLCY